MIQKLRKVISVLLLTAVLAIGFCTPSYAVGIPVSEWKLTSLNGTSPVGQRAITLNIDGEAISGLAWCNRYFTRFSTDDSSKITVVDIATTKSYCSDMEQELQYIRALRNVKTYSVDGTTLSLTNPEEKIDLKFSKL